jgi:hypothetical protein
MNDSVNTIVAKKGWTTPDPVRECLYIISPLYNATRFKSRWKLYNRFEKHVRASGGILYTGEIAFGEREFAVEQVAQHKTIPDDEDVPPLIQTNELTGDCRHDDPRRGQHKYYRYRTKTELWHKERLINIMAQRLPSDWKYVAWVDCDVLFVRPNWVGECIHQLQHYDFLQMFSSAHDLTADYEVYSERPAFMKAYMEGGAMWPPNQYYYEYPRKGFGAWSGLAWACTRRAWDTVGGLIDVAVTGASDWYQAWALIGELEPRIPAGSHPNFSKALLRWQDRWMTSPIRKNVGYMTGSCLHNHHGSKSDRQYTNRANLLAEYQFDPERDLKFDSQGLWQFQDNGDDRYVNLRDGIRKWARSRNEDSPEI